LVGEAGKHGWHNNLEILGKLLCEGLVTSGFAFEKTWVSSAVGTHRTESDRGSSQTYQASIPCMRLMNGISILVTELIKNSFDLGVVLGGDTFTNQTL